MTANLVPAQPRKYGPSYDLPIAVGLYPAFLLRPGRYPVLLKLNEKRAFRP